MTSAAKAQANQQNATLSTGPKSKQGKRRSAKNALKHGLRSSELLIGDERKNDFLRLRDQFFEALQPVGALEANLVERLIVCAWRLKRSSRLEMSLFERARELRIDMHNKCGKDREIGLAAEVASDFSRESGNLMLLCRYESTLERSYFRALHELQRLQAARAGLPVAPPMALDVDVSLGSLGNARP